MRLTTPHVLLATMLVPALASAQNQPTPGSPYTVQAGDTCVSIATRAYGDRKRVDLVHKGNPDLGPQPHQLKPGRVLVIPPASGAPTAADAKLRAVRNVVRVQVPAEKVGKPNEPLYRGNRVVTEERSGADVLFLDESELRLGERTLIVILGDTSSRVREAPRETTLVSGDLSAKLAKLSTHTIVTDGATVALQGRARIEVDAKKRTSLASLAGSSKLTAQKKTIPVHAGYGSSADLGKAPTEPRLLPKAAAWSTRWPALVLVPKGGAGTAQGELASAASGIQSVRVQIARDSSFGDLISEVVVPASTTRIESQNLGPGVYYARTASVDDRFTGEFGESVVTRVAAYVERTDGTGIEVDDPTVHCGAPTTSGKVLCNTGEGTTDVVVALSDAARPRPAAPPVAVVPPPPPPVLPERPAHGFDLTVSAGFGSAWKFQNPGVRGEVTLAYAFPVGPGALAVGGALGFDGYPRFRRGGTLRDGVEPARDNVAHWDASVGVPIAYRFLRRDASLWPSVQLQPELIVQHASFTSAAGNDSAVSALFGLRATAGVQARVGAWAVTADGGYRFSTKPETGATFRGPILLVGLRRFF